MMETNKKTEKSMLRAKKAHWTGIMRKAIACFINSYDESSKFNYPLYNTNWFNHPCGMR